MALRFASLLLVQLVCWLNHSSSDTFVGFNKQQHLLLLNLCYFAFLAGGLSSVTRKVADRKGVESLEGYWWYFLLFVQLVCWLNHSSSDTVVQILIILYLMSPNPLQAVLARGNVD